jgi:hypothetical protein
MPFSYLTQAQIDALKGAFESANLSYDRDARRILFAGIPKSYLDRLEDAGNNHAQLTIDLDALNTTKHLDDGATVPLKVWLKNARDDLFSALPDANVFKQTLEELETQPDLRPQVSKIKEVLQTVWVRIRSDDAAHNAVNFYREIFRQARHEIDIISDYKNLHESLHTLKMSWGDSNIESYVARLPGDPDALMSVQKYADLLDNIVQDLRDTLEKQNVDPRNLKSFSGAGQRNWVEDLEAYKEDFVLTIDRCQKAEIVRIFNTINGNLGPTLSELNNHLKGAVEKMRLDRLIGALSKVCDELTRIDRERTAAKVEQYRIGIKELSDLDERLRGLKEQHDQWQRVDNQIVMFDQMLSLAAQKGEAGQVLDMIWTMLKTSIVPLYADNAARWALDMKRAAENIRAALDAKDDDSARRWFQFYRATANKRFFDLDKEMITQCRALSAVGEELRKIDDELETM